MLYLVLFVFIDKEGDKKSQKILAELENIDDECEEKGISFVKTSDEGVDKEYDLPELPAVVYYRNKFRKIYNGMYRDFRKKEILILQKTE